MEDMMQEKKEDYRLQRLVRLKRINWVGKYPPSLVMELISLTLTTEHRFALALILKKDNSHVNISTLLSS